MKNPLCVLDVPGEVPSSVDLIVERTEDEITGLQLPFFSRAGFVSVEFIGCAACVYTGGVV
jgi:hypothetical protein